MIRLILQCVYTEKSLVVETRLFPILLIKEKKRITFILFHFHIRPSCVSCNEMIHENYLSLLCVYIHDFGRRNLTLIFFHALARARAHTYTHTNQSETAITFFENVFYKNSFLKSVQTHAAFVYVSHVICRLALSIQRWRWSTAYSIMSSVHIAAIHFLFVFFSTWSCIRIYILSCIAGYNGYVLNQMTKIFLRVKILSSQIVI